MSLIVTRILCSILRLFIPNIPNYSTGAIDGDIAGELDNIKLEIDQDNISYIDLLCSLTFLKNGLRSLCSSLNESEPDEAATDPTPEDQVETSRMSSVAESNILSEAVELSLAIERFKINYSSEFESAKYAFADADRKATCAFNCTDLSITHRILATKCRLFSSILKYLDDFEKAISVCFSCLQDMHSLPDTSVRHSRCIYVKPNCRSVITNE